MNIVVYLLILCLATCVLESIALLHKENWREWFKPALLCNILTNPILNMLLPAVYFYIPAFPFETGVSIVVLCLLCLELGVVVLEAWMFGLFINEPFFARLKTSLAINTFSFIWGAILTLSLTTVLK